MVNCQRAGSFRCKRALEVGDRNPQEQNTVASWNPCLCSARIGEVVQMREVGCRHNRAVNRMTTSLEPLQRRHKISPELRMAPTFRNLTWGVSSKWMRVFLRFAYSCWDWFKGKPEKTPLAFLGTPILTHAHVGSPQNWWFPFALSAKPKKALLS